MKPKLLSSWDIWEAAFNGHTERQRVEAFGEQGAANPTEAWASIRVRHKQGERLDWWVEQTLQLMGVYLDRPIEFWDVIYRPDGTPPGA